MATMRSVNVNFWRDNYVGDLDPIEKLLFLYFLTNGATNLAGIYEVNFRAVAFETGIDKEMIMKILERFVADGKMWYGKGWLVLRNFRKHQKYNPSMNIAVKKTMDELPDFLKQELKNMFNDNKLPLFAEQPVDRLGTGSPHTMKKLSHKDEVKIEVKKEIKIENEVEAKAAGKPAKAPFFNNFDKKTQEQAKQADEEQAKRALKARSRKGSFSTVSQSFDSAPDPELERLFGKKNGSN